MKTDDAIRHLQSGKPLRVVTKERTPPKEFTITPKHDYGVWWYGVNNRRYLLLDRLTLANWLDGLSVVES